MTSKYCERCRTKTKRYVTGRCKPCQRATTSDLTSAARARRFLVTTINSSRFRSASTRSSSGTFKPTGEYQCEWHATNKATATPGNYYWKKGQQPPDPPQP